LGTEGGKRRGDLITTRKPEGGRRFRGKTGDFRKVNVGESLIKHGQREKELWRKKREEKNSNKFQKGKKGQGVGGGKILEKNARCQMGR